MAYQNNNHDFTDWLYNRYVEALRKKDAIRMMLFWDVLNHYVSKALSNRKLSGLKRHGKELIKRVENARKNGTSGKLLLTGEEGQIEFEKAMVEYEQRLREYQYPEELITKMVIDKRWNYGND